jgi:hypothetical protein
MFGPAVRYLHACMLHVYTWYSYHAKFRKVTCTLVKETVHSVCLKQVTLDTNIFEPHNMPLFLSFRSGYTSPVCVKVHVGCSTTKHNTKI